MVNPPTHPRRPRAGFARFEFFLVAALGLAAVAVAVPPLLRGQYGEAVRRPLALLAVVALGFGLLVGKAWLDRYTDGGRGQWLARLVRACGHLVRGLLGAGLGLALAGGLAANHDAGPRAMGLALAGGGLLGAGAALLAHRRLGGEAFWGRFQGFALALAGAFLGGLVGLVLESPWGVDIGVLGPLAIYAAIQAWRSRSRIPPAA